MPLTADRDTQAYIGKKYVYPMEADTVLYGGAIACLNSSGNLVPGSTASDLTAVGRSAEQVDNAGGAAGDKNGNVERGVFCFDNSTGADEITLADVGSACFIVDDETVAKTDDGGSRSQAGIVRDVNGLGVWVEF